MSNTEEFVIKSIFLEHLAQQSRLSELSSTLPSPDIVADFWRSVKKTKNNTWLHERILCMIECATKVNEYHSSYDKILKEIMIENRSLRYKVMNILFSIHMNVYQFLDAVGKYSDGFDESQILLLMVDVFLFVLKKLKHFEFEKLMSYQPLNLKS